MLLKKLRDALESLRGRLSGQNKEDVEKAIAMVSSYANYPCVARTPLFHDLMDYFSSWFLWLSQHDLDCNCIWLSSALKDSQVY